LVKAREEKDLTQREAALNIGISQQNLSRYEAGSIEPPAGVLLVLSNTYNVSIDYLIKGKDPAPRGYNPPSLQVETVKKYSRRVTNAIEQGLYVPVRLLKDSVAAGEPAAVDENHVEGWALIYADRQWMPNDPESYTCVKVKGRSMYPVLDNGDIVAIDHAERDPKYLDGKMVAFRVNGGVTIKWLKYKPKEKTVVGVPENHEELDHVVILVGPEIDEGIVGLVRWWWAKR
jgi:transcriptional regulator with XRE-family HTH domain